MSDRDFRLSQSIRPLRYVLRFEVDLDSWSYLASESIVVRLAEPLSSITLHAVDLDIIETTVSADNTSWAAEVTRNEEAQTITLTLPEILSVEEANIHIRFRGAILDRLSGFYRSEKDGARYASTQFEAADARCAFPCFDEPEFKAQYTITLVVPSGLVAVSNSAIEQIIFLEDRKQEVCFAETPPISSYLVAFAVGPFEATETVETPSGIPVRVVLPRGLADKGIFARDAHAQALGALEAYTGILYPYGKVDAIGVPDFEMGAMENPGAIMYRLTALATDPEYASTHTLKEIFYTAAHELTHMWWGDLVTMKWWNDLWLNESFATFVGYKVTTDLKPEWGMWRDFVTTVTRAFSLDALQSTHPISFEVHNAAQATERFDIITYWKGAAVVRMIEGFLGADVFRAGVRAYLKRYSEGNATADEFWHELDVVSGVDVTTLATAWIKEAGHPIVRVEARRVGDDLHLALQQERFYADSELSSLPLWPIPLVIKYGNAGGAHETRFLFDEARDEVVLPEATWYFLNAEAAGFYRFATDEESQQALVKVMTEVLEPHERLSLLDNEWALLKAGQLSLKQFFLLLEGYRTETDRAVLAMLTDHFDWLSTHVVTEVTRPAFARYIQKFYGPHYETLGWEPITDEPTDVRMKRASVLHALGDIAADQDIRLEAHERQARHFEGINPLDPNIASVVARLSAKVGNRELHDQYVEKKRAAKTDPEEEARFLMALAAFEEPELVALTLSFTMTEEVRAQDRPALLSALLTRRHSRDAAWNHIREQWDELELKTNPMLFHNLLRALGHLVHHSEEVRAFLATRSKDHSRETIAQVDERLRLEANAVKRLASEFDRLFRES